MADWRESDWRERPGWERPGARYAGEEVARRPVRRDLGDPRYEGERAEREGFGDSRHWGGYGSDHTDRRLAERAGDEIRSWLGDRDAEKRRRMDETDAWRVPGPYSGVGPRGWTRSDERIKATSASACGRTARSTRATSTWPSPAARSRCRARSARGARSGWPRSSWTTSAACGTCTTG